MIKTQPKFHRVVAAVLAASGASGMFVACTGLVDLNGRPCPCVTGYECCDGVCVTPSAALSCKTEASSREAGPAPDAPSQSEASSVPETSVFETSMTDASLFEAWGPDTSQPDTSPDTSQPDASPDTSQPDTSPDTSRGDAWTPDTSRGDASTPDAPIPDAWNAEAASRDAMPDLDGDVDASLPCTPGPTVVGSGALAFGKTASTDLYYTGTFETNACVHLTDSNTSALYTPDSSAIPKLTTGLTVLHTYEPAGPGMQSLLAQPPGRYTIDNVILTYNPGTYVYTWSFHGVNTVFCDAGCQYIDSIHYRVVVQ